MSKAKKDIKVPAFRIVPDIICKKSLLKIEQKVPFLFGLFYIWVFVSFANSKEDAIKYIEFLRTPTQEL